MYTTTIALACVLAAQTAGQADPNHGLAQTPGEPQNSSSISVVSRQDSSVKKIVTAEIIRNDVEIRSAANSKSSVIFTIAKGATATVLESKQDWFKLEFTNKTTGWVHKTALKLTQAKIELPAPPAALLPATEQADSEVNRTKILKISIADGQSSVLKPTDPEPTRPAPVAPVQTAPTQPTQKQPEKPIAKQQEDTFDYDDAGSHSPFGAPAKKSTGSSSKAEQILSYARTMTHVRYVWAAEGSRGQFDCSSWVRHVFAKHGVTLPRIAMEQATMGVAVQKSNLQPGDLVFFRSRQRRVGHVGIYMGGGKFIHCSSGAGKVVISELSSNYYATNYVGAKRVLTGPQKLSGPMALPNEVHDGEEIH